MVFYAASVAIYEDILITPQLEHPDTLCAIGCVGVLLSWHHRVPEMKAMKTS
jgi:hypothetical protein